MKEQCFDEGTIQAFLDGELAPELLENVARHVALCDSCALLLQESEEESAFAFSILDDELNSLVPTERIRANVYQAISQLEQPKTSFWQKFLGFAASLANPTVAAFASILILVGVFAALMSLRNQPSIPDGNEVIATKTSKDVEPVTVTPINDSTPVDEINKTTLKTTGQPKFDKVSYKSEPKVDNRKPFVRNPSPSVERKENIESIDGEATYLKTIATLENTIKDKKDSVLRASSRVSFERDMAVVEDSIKRMKAEVRKNPKNEAAKQILRNSYQNKIELLNSLSERSEFMASLD